MKKKTKKTKKNSHTIQLFQFPHRAKHLFTHTYTHVYIYLYTHFFVVSFVDRKNLNSM